MLKHYPLLTETKTWKNTHTTCTNILYYQPTLHYLKTKLKQFLLYVLLVCQNTEKHLKICYYWTDATMQNYLTKLLSFSNRSAYDLIVEKVLLLWLNSIACGEHFTIWLWQATVRSFSQKYHSYISAPISRVNGCNTIPKGKWH